MNLRLLHLLAIVALVLVQTLSAQDVQSDVEEKSLAGSFFDETLYQLEARASDEEELKEDEEDREELEFPPVEVGDLPKEQVSTADLQKYLAEELRVQDKTDLAEFNPYVAYSTSDFLVSWKCCPRKQGYACRSYKRRLPCFYHYTNGVRVRCCPFYPSYAIQSVNCNCSKCAVLTPYCASVGRCQRRFTWRSFYAVCDTRPWWSVKSFKRRVATSCYCRTHC